MSQSCACGRSPCAHFDEFVPWDPFLKEWWEHWVRIFEDMPTVTRPFIHGRRELVPTAELSLDVVPRIELDSGDVSLYGTSGDLDPRGYWAPDVG